MKSGYTSDRMIHIVNYNSSQFPAFPPENEDYKRKVMIRYVFAQNVGIFRTLSDRIIKWFAIFESKYIYTERNI